MTRMRDDEQGEEGPAPLGALVTLSLILPGAGQLANGEKVKGWVYIGLALILMAALLIQAAMMFPPLIKAAASGAQTPIDEALIGQVKTLLEIIAGALMIWVIALVDTIIVGRRKLAARSGGGR